MQKLETGIKKHRLGFTLIEILIVLFIIGIIVSFALLAFGDFGEKKRILASAEQFKNFVTLVQQEAILESQTLGVIVEKNGYHPARLHNDHWVKINFQHLKSHAFPPRIEINLAKQRNPLVIVNANGDLSPFNLKFSTRDNPNIINIIGNDNGTISLQ